MKFLLLLSSIVFLQFNGSTQNLKTYNGEFADGRTQNGIATYTYYENDSTQDYVKHGNFKYVFKGQDSYLGFDEVITGTFKNGLKNGVWSYQITMKDFGNSDYTTGTVSLIANYKNGYADGTWKEKISTKTRGKMWNGGKIVWGNFTKQKNLLMSLNFKGGKIIDSVIINDEFANFSAKGTFDKDSYCIGKWIFNDKGWNKNRELTYKNSFLLNFIIRDNYGKTEDGYIPNATSIKYIFMDKKSLDSIRTRVISMCGNDDCAVMNNLQEHLKKVFVNEYFLYESIQGDLTYKEGIKGGCELYVKE